MMALLSKVLSASGAELNTATEKGDADGVEAMARQQVEPHQIAQGVGERQYGHAASGAANGLALSPPLCALPVAVDLHDGGVHPGVFHVRLIREGI